MTGLLLIAQLVVLARAPDTASACAPIEISVAARAPGAVAPTLASFVPPAGVQLLKSTITSRVERDGRGQATSLTEASYTVAAEGSGRVVLSPFVVTVGGQRATASAGPVEVHPGLALPPVVIVRARLDRAGRGAPADTLYVGQQVDYVVDVQLNEGARQRLRRNPTFFPPEMPGVIAYDLAPPSALTRVGRRCFETLSYRRALFPLFAGRAAIAPASLTYSLPLSTSFFSREESFELRTDSVHFLALDVPVTGRPPEFGGAVGSLSATARVSPPRGRMGDPLVLTLRLSGNGNVKLWPRPPLRLGWAAIANGGERVVVDTSLSLVKGSKEFDWLLTPRQPGQQVIPSIVYSYFDPQRRSYTDAHAPSLSLDIVAAALVVIDSMPAARLGIRRALREALPPALPARPWFWLLLAIAPAPAAARRARNRTRRRTERRSATRRLQQARARAEPLTARALRRLYLEAVGDRVPRTIGSTRPADFTRALRLAGVTEQTAHSAGVLLEHLDNAAFSPSGTIGDDAVASADASVRAVYGEAVRPVTAMVSSRTVVGLVLLLSSAAALRAMPDGVAATFTQGVEAYDHAAFTTAERLFGRVAARVPRSVDAWANLGTASWSRGDSASAVRGWQRALRLDPLDDELRDRIDAVTPVLVRSPAYVPPVPVNVLALLALACWLGAWGLMAIPSRYRVRHTRAIAGGAMSVGVVALLGALELADRLEPHSLAVLRSSRSLFVGPGSGVAIANATIGETGLLGVREGGWVRIALGAGRAGWVPVASVLPLDAPPGDP